MIEQTKPERRSIEVVQYNFTLDELRLLGEQLARESEILTDLNQKKKEVAAAMKVAITEAEGRAAALARKINERHEYRDAECTALMHTPRVGMKSIVRVDTGEIVREERMTVDELQEKLAFEAPKEDDESQPYKKRKDVN
ncbi:MAG TPA: hypothetical protein VGG61_14940 [Gemmataceae bacterium]